MILEYPKAIFAPSAKAIQQFADKYNEIQQSEFETKYGKTTYNKNEDGTTITTHAKDENNKSVSSYKLRESHINLLQEYVRLYARQIGQWNSKCSINNNMGAAIINTLSPPSLRTNNVELSGRMKKVAESTIYRRTKRLIEAGLITKVHHGSTKDYEIIINPFVIYLEDNNNTDKFSELNTDKAFIWAKNAKCNPNTGNLTRNLNKIIIETELQSNILNLQDTSLETIKEFSNENIILQDTKQDTLTGNTRKKAKNGNKSMQKIKKDQLETSPATKKTERSPYVDLFFAKIEERNQKNASQNSPQLSYAEKLAQKAVVLKKMRLKFAALLLQTMIEGLLPPTWKNYNEYNQRVINYITENYLGNIQTYEGLEKEMIRLNARLKIAIKHKINHPEYKSPAPMTYFDLENTENGFVNTKRMLKTSEKWNKIGNKRKSWQTDYKKLHEAVKRYVISPNNSTLQQEIAYVNTNIPHLNKNFLKLALYPTDNSQLQSIN